MPQTPIKKGPELTIHLDRPDSTYIPGEVITGQISRKTHIVTASATVSISLHARSKSRMVARRGHLTSTYRGRFDLLQSAEYSKTIFEGPLHVAENDAEQSWKFSISLPSRVDGPALQSLAGPGQTFLTGDVSEQPLPPTFLIESYDYMSGMSAFVEYYLQAELKTTSRGSGTSESILPFRMLYINPEPLPAQIDLHTARHTPALQGDNPMVASVEVQTPTTLQIEGPGPMSFLVLAVPPQGVDLGKQKPGLPSIQIIRIFMNVVGKTEIKCPKGKNVHETDCEARITLHAEDAFNQYDEDLYIPWQRPATETQQLQGGGSASETGPLEGLDIGAKLGLRLQRNKGLYPSFQTFNIRHTHRLKWEMTVEAAGKSFELSGEEPIKVLSRPEAERNTEWIQPPPEDHLPSFSDDEDVFGSGSRRSSRQTDPAAGVGGLSRLWVF
ncbi:Arrestin-like, C-terminal [Fusarium oxysporum f. sp. vasinfectum]|uniref:Arrestin-like N-terminal domain-containing protein n=1 Tax=Fusarium oxysporum f. sp. vasinfectum 25433 TaxID=1089449 RepID=X0MQX2_FUSOX|nr:hypothetical protein FOTG_09689 [Fusarium oxysporum f. sp. vasinfectum 25433]KAK2669235.1 Arrestin-like, C-terminal [Fusarium oxysporum f. sp. vasinfectum]KAK2924794.1 Arrestin-like, C-terminal [Fusarium oxysporum f. sp. vasinfectum]